ncbi:DUF2510 domain-containing protein [Protaetiibacter intestinalis]|uniref:DUF2510 domain-containing protein n=1 Tax=Protaetiibacter intestinalis TaxID=2419774 RepID=A0A387BDD0_9MICO|nr:DUF2510 domain-containing protein [Protaetiibacter intestinalis]AYF98889.1 DUF2510 domain-containing protein [Protaetiibacter intestinalis]
MTDQATRVVPAGWYQDPSDAEKVRWWNGIAWTDHTQDKPDLDAIAEAETAELEEKFAESAAVRSRVRVRSTSTSESWLLAFSPILLALGLLAAGWAWLYVSPQLLWVGVAVAVVYAFGVVVALLDRRKLRRWGHTAPGVILVILGAFVYLLGRAVRLKSWALPIVWLGLLVALVGGPAAAWFGGALPSVQLAVGIQAELRDELVGNGTASAVSCPPVADTTTVGSLYTCDVTLVDGSHKTLWVSIDSEQGDYSTSFAIN